MGEELFQADLVPSETDYKNFVDFGNIPGIWHNDYIKFKITK